MSSVTCGDQGLHDVGVAVHPCCNMRTERTRAIMMAGTRIGGDPLLTVNSLALEATVCDSNAMKGDRMAKSQQRGLTP
jgi:hypothetical protein